MEYQQEIYIQSTSTLTVSLVAPHLSDQIRERVTIEIWQADFLSRMNRVVRNKE